MRLIILSAGIHPIEQIYRFCALPLVLKMSSLF